MALGEVWGKKKKHATARTAAESSKLNKSQEHPSQNSQGTSKGFEEAVAPTSVFTTIIDSKNALLARFCNAKQASID